MTNCELCGEPMPPNEQMFKYHGYSGGCPKPPITSRPVAPPYSAVGDGVAIGNSARRGTPPTPSPQQSPVAPPHEHRCENPSASCDDSGCVCRCGATKKGMTGEWRESGRRPVTPEISCMGCGQVKPRATWHEPSGVFLCGDCVSAIRGSPLSPAPAQEARARLREGLASEILANLPDYVVDASNRCLEELSRLRAENERLDKDNTTLGDTISDLLAEDTRLRAQVEDLLTPEEAQALMYAATEDGEFSNELHAKLRRIAGSQP